MRTIDIQLTVWDGFYEDVVDDIYAIEGIISDIKSSCFVYDVKVI